MPTKSVRFTKLSTVKTIILAVIVWSSHITLKEAAPLFSHSKLARNAKVGSERKVKTDVGEYGHWFQGDITNGPNLTHMRAGDKVFSTWTRRTIYYQFATHVETNDSDRIKTGMKNIMCHTCLRFVEDVDPIIEDFILFTTDAQGCFSKIGRTMAKGKSQQVNYEKNSDCSRSIGTIMHEIMHALGFWHEHARPDRDAWITINEANIEDAFKFNFDPMPMHQWDSYGVEYDYQSVMHYDPFAFAKDHSIPVITAIKPVPPGVTIGQRIKMSPKDIQQINLMYNCSAFA